MELMAKHDLSQLRQYGLSVQKSFGKKERKNKLNQVHFYSNVQYDIAVLKEMERKQDGSSNQLFLICCKRQLCFFFCK